MQQATRETYLLKLFLMLKIQLVTCNNKAWYATCECYKVHQLSLIVELYLNSKEHVTIWYSSHIQSIKCDMNSRESQNIGTHTI